MHVLALRCLGIGAVITLSGGVVHSQAFRLSRHIPRIETGIVSEFSVHGERALFWNGAVFQVPVDGSRRPQSLSSPIQTSSVTSASSPVVSPDGVHVVYWRNDGTRGEVVRTPLDREQPLILAQHGVLGYEPVGFTPDSSWFLYRYHNDLWSVRVDGSQPAIFLHTRQTWHEIHIAPDGLHVLVRTRSPVSGGQLFSLTIDGSQPQINLAPAFVDIDEFAGITSDGVHAVFRAGTIGFMNLLRVRVDGSAGPELIHLGGPNVDRFGAFAGDRLVYTTVSSTSGLVDYYSVPQDFSTVPIPIALGMRGVAQFADKISSDGRSMVLPGVDAGDSSLLHRVALDGSALQSLGVVANRVQFRLDPSGRTVLFDPASTPSVQDLAAVPLDGSSPPWTITTDPVEFTSLVGDASGRRIVYWQALSSGDFQVHAAALDVPSPPVGLDLVRTALFRLRPHLEVVGEQVLVVDEDELGSLALFGVPLAGTSARELSQDAFTMGIGDVTSFELSPSGAWSVYAGDVRTSGVVELFSTNKLEHHCLSQSHPGVSSFSISEDSSRVVFLADGLFTVPITGGQPPLLLSVPGEPVYLHELVPGGEVLFFARVSGVDRLYVAPVDGSVPARLLPFSFATEVFKFSPDGQWILYKPNFSAQLWSAPLDGHAQPVMLGSALFDQFKITPDSTRVVWKNSYPSLRSAPIDGSGAGVTLSDLTLTAEIGNFELTSNSQSVVFTHGGELFFNAVTASSLRTLASGIDAFQMLAKSARVVFESGDIYHVVPISGGVPTPLHGDEVDVFGPLTIAIDESEALFLGRSQDGSTTGMYRISLNVPGSAALVLPQGVASVKLLPDGERFVFASQRNLFLARLDGIGSPRRLNPDLANGDGVSAYSVGPQGKHLVYRASQHSPFTYELYGSFLEDIDPHKPGPGAPTDFVSVEVR